MGSRVRHATRSLQALTLSRLEERFRPLLPADLLQLPSAGANSRERVFGLSRTFFCWLWQMLQLNTSCREVVRQLQALLALQGGGALDEHSSAYCQARARLPKDRLEKALHATATKAFQRAPALPLLQGRPLKAVDGTGLRAADTPANQKRYPQPLNQKPGCGFPVLRLVVLFCMTSGAVLAHATGSLYHAEVSLLRRLLGSLKRSDILVGDRGFGHFVVLALLARKGVDTIARVSTASRRVDWRRGQRLGRDDRLHHWRKAESAPRWIPRKLWRRLANTMTVRLVRTRITVKGCRTKEITLVTTLLDAKAYPKQEILAAYLRRWRLEMCLKDLKSTLGLKELKCLTPDMVEKELLVGLLLHNLLRCIMAEAAQTHSVDLERISFKGSLDAIRQFSAAAAQTLSAKKRRVLWQRLLQTLASDLVPERPSRREPRAIKRRPKYPLLTRHRRDYIDRFSREKRRSLARARKRHGLN
jgi:Transposase DDE domain